MIFSLLIAPKMVWDFTCTIGLCRNPSCHLVEIICEWIANRLTLLSNGIVGRFQPCFCHCIYISILFESTCSTTSLVLYLINWVLTVQTFLCVSPGLSSAIPSGLTWINDGFWEVSHRFEREGGFLLPMITGTVFSLGLTVSSLFNLSDLICGTTCCSECVGCSLLFLQSQWLCHVLVSIYCYERALSVSHEQWLENYLKIS